MHRQFLFPGLVAVALGGMAVDAHAGIPIPVIWGSDEKMTELGELPSDASREIDKELGKHVTVGFLNERMHVFYLDLWTWNGRYVLFSGDDYWELEDGMWRDLLGEEPSARYGTPILYRIPLLPVILAVGLAAWLVHKTFFKTDQEKLESLMKDRRYQQAAEILIGTSSGEGPDPATPAADNQRFQQAKTYLMNQGISPGAAEANLKMIFQSILTGTNKRVDMKLQLTSEQVDAYLKLADELQQQEKWDKSVKLYSQVISALPDSDPRKDLAANSLNEIKVKRLGSTGK